jgi:hypothetical protein
MNPVTLESISSQILDLEGFCRIHRDMFGERDDMGHAFEDISRHLGQIRRSVDELHGTTPRQP